MPPHPSLKRIIEERAILTREDARELMQQILAGEISDIQLAALLSSLATRGETPTEIAGFVDAMRAAATPVPLEESERNRLVDTCGTGADLSGTFNISTAAALVAAAAGATVAKHGNRAVTSQSGSADVLEALGIPIGLTPDEGAAALRANHFAFLHAPSLHPAMKTVMPVRRALGIRTIFHLVGPLSNPAGARAQVMGVYATHLVPIVAEAMRLLGTHHAFVVHGGTGTQSSGLDELSISGTSQLAEVRGDSVTFLQLTPEQVGLQTAPLESLQGGDAAVNAQILRDIFGGELSPRRDVVLLNAAAVLITAGLVPPAPAPPSADTLGALRAGIALAAATIDSGAVTRLMSSLATKD